MKSMLKANKIQLRALRRRNRQGFTLIELLVVIAITIVLLLLLFGPLITGFRLTARAQATTEAQDASRVAMEQITRELQSAAGVRDTAHQYLDMPMYVDQNGAISEVTAHAYDSYLDIIPPRPFGSSNGSGLYDPTLNNSNTPVKILKTGTGNPVIVPNDVALPLAPGTTIIRYFIGLRHPINLDYTPGGAVAAEPQPYVDSNEGQLMPAANTTYVVKNHLDNEYVLYRAEVQPYTTTTTNGTTTVAINSDFFQPDPSNTAAPWLDDPDFFNVLPRDAANNQRVYNWYRIAKPVIDLPNVNLIFQPHDGSNKVVYDAATGWPRGTLTDTDGVTPLIRTSVSFGPASISNDPLHATNASDVSQGYGSEPGDATVSLRANGNPITVPYIPSIFKASYGQWQGGPSVSISDANSIIYTTYVVPPTPSAPQTSEGAKAGDLMEQVGGTDVYDVTQGSVIGTPSNYVAMTVNGDAGTVNFAVPDIPSTDNPVPAGTNMVGTADTSNKANPYWFITYGRGYSGDSVSGFSNALMIHLKAQPGVVSDDVLLPKTAVTAYSSAGMGRVVVNSERVYGPEQDQGPASDTLVAGTISGTANSPITYPLVPYHRVPLDIGGVGSIGYDQYMIDYNNGIVYLGTVPKNMNTSFADPARRTVLVAFSSQNNFAVTGTTVTPDNVHAGYLTGSEIGISIGVRLADPSSGNPTYFSLTSNVAVGNSTQ